VIYIFTTLSICAAILFGIAVRVDGQQRGEYTSIPWYAATFLMVIATLFAGLLTLFEVM